MLHQDFEEEKEELNDVNTSTIEVKEENEYLAKLREKTLKQVELKIIV